MSDKKARYQKLNPRITPLSDGENLPSHMINSEYKQQSNHLRKCIECGKCHDCILEDSITGDRLKEVDRCKECFLKKMF